MIGNGVDASRPLAGLVSLITGAAGGVGYAVARAFAEAGSGLALVDVEEVRLNEKVQALEESTEEILSILADVSLEDSGRDVVDQCVDRFGRVDVVVNNAAVQGPAGSVVEAEEVDWDRYLAVNLRGPSRLLRAVLPVMCDQGGGSVVNVSSVSGLMALPRQAAYAASKAALIQLTRSVAVDFGKRGVRANCICPGPILSGPVLAGRSEEDAARDPGVVALVGRHMTGRLATPQDIAYAALYLAGPFARHVTGAVLVVDGGFSIG